MMPFVGLRIQAKAAAAREACSLKPGECDERIASPSEPWLEIEPAGLELSSNCLPSRKSLSLSNGQSAIKHHSGEKEILLERRSVVKNVSPRLAHSRRFEKPLPRPCIQSDNRQSRLERIGKSPRRSVPLPRAKHRQSKLENPTRQSARAIVKKAASNLTVATAA